MPYFDPQRSENYHKLQRLLKVCTDVLQTEFHKTFSKNPLKLSNQLQDIKEELKVLKQRKKLTDSQWKVLFPKDHLVDPTRFDISLLFPLLTEFCLKENPPRRGWNNTPDDSDGSLPANVARMHNVRNNVQHGNYETSDDDFEKYWKLLETALRNMDYDMEVIKEIKNTPLLANTLHGIKWEIYDPVISFTGREQELNDLKCVMVQDHLGATVCAFAGVGKTELCKAYCKNESENYNDNLLWINAETRNTMVESFRNIGQYLKRKQSDQDGNQLSVKVLVKNIYRYFINQKSLFIFDNAKSYHDIKDFLPDDGTESRPKILITSQNMDWSSPVVKYELDIFSKEAALRFLTERLKENKFQEDSSKSLLAETLEYHPLALQISVAYMNRRDMTCKRFLEIFRKNAKVILNKPYAKTSGYTKTVLTAFKTSLMQISNHNESQFNMLILNIMSHIDGKNMEDRILSMFCANMEFDTSGTIELLEDNALIQKKKNFVDGNVYYVMHSLIQLVIRLSNQEVLTNDCTGRQFSAVTEEIQMYNSSFVVISFQEDHNHFYIKQFLDVIEALYSRVASNIEIKKVTDQAIQNNRLIHADGEWLHHILHLIKYNSHYEKIMNELERYKSSVFHVLVNRGTYGTLKDVLEEYLLHEEKVNAKNEIMETKRFIAQCLRLQGSYEEALNLLNVLHIHEGQLQLQSGNSQTKHLIAMCNLDLGRYAQALSKFQGNFESNQELFGKKDLRTLRSKYMTAMCLRNQGHYSKSLQLFQEIRSTEQEILTENDTNSLLTRHMIAVCLQDIGDYSKAYEIFTENCQLQAEILGKSHPSTLLTSHMIAICLLRNGRSLDAYEMFEENYKIQENMDGVNNPAAVRSKHNMARCLNKEGRYNDALIMLKAILEIQKSLFVNERNPKILRTKHVMAVCLQFQGKYAVAHKEFNEMFIQKISIYSMNHRSTLITRYRVCWCLLEQGHYQNALEMFKVNLELEEQLIRLDSPNTLATRAMIAWCLLFCGEYSSAADMFMKNYEQEKKKPGEINPKSIRSRNMISICMKLEGKQSQELDEENRQEDEKQLKEKTCADNFLCQHTVGLFMFCRGDCNRALLIFEANLKLHEGVVTKINPIIVRTKYLIVLCHMRLGNISTALEKLQEILSVLVDPYQVINAKHLIGICQWRTGEIDEALKMFRENLDAIETSFKSNNRILLKTKHIIAVCMKESGDFDGSYERLQNVYEDKKRIFGEKSPSTIRTLQTLQAFQKEKGSGLKESHEIRERSMITLSAEEREDCSDECIVFEEYDLKPQELIGEMNTIYAQYMSHI